MSEIFDLVVSGGTCLLPGGRVETDIAVRHQRIVAFGDLANAEARERIDARGLHVLPGVIDSQVHFREPGAEHKEDLESGTRGAVLGGVTAVFEMPNTRPATISQTDLEEKLARAAGRAWCDHAFYIGGAPENVGQLAMLERLPGCAGVKIFMGSSTGTLLMEDEEMLARAMADGSRRIALHAEDEARLKERRHLAEEAKTPAAHPLWRDEKTALFATERLLRLAGNARRRVHVLHVTTAEEMRLLVGFRDVATVEVTPQHLTLAAPECYERLGTYAQMNPPIREVHHREALWQALAGGLVDVIGSDHAPHTREEKEKPYPDSPSGMPGVQTLLPVMLNHVHEGRLSLERLVDLVCTGPARVFNLALKGRLALGYDGDLTLVDLKSHRRIDSSWIASRSGWTPFDGMMVTGWPVVTIIRGHTVMRDDQLLGTPLGRPLRFTECLAAVG